MPQIKPEIRFETIHGYRRAFLLAGSGPAVLLIHGIGDNADTWLPVIDRLARHNTVVAPDLLGHGRSDKPRADYSIGAYANGMRDLLSVLEIPRVTAVGHSLGGGVAAQFAYQYPERCERLVLVSSGGVGPEVSPILRLATVPGSELLMPLFGFPPVRVASRVIGFVLHVLGTGVGHDAREVLDVFDALPNAVTRQAILRTLRAAVDWKGQSITMLDRGYLVEGMPTQLIWGDRDAIIPVSHALLAQQELPGSRLELFEDAGHFPHHADPDRFVHVLRRFMASTSPSNVAMEEWGRRLRRGREQVRMASGAPEDVPPEIEEPSGT